MCQIRLLRHSERAKNLHLYCEVDHTRVVLNDMDPNVPGSDYINANYIRVGHFSFSAYKISTCKICLSLLLNWNWVLSRRVVPSGSNLYLRASICAMVCIDGGYNGGD